MRKVLPLEEFETFTTHHMTDNKLYMRGVGVTQIPELLIWLNQVSPGPVSGLLPLIPTKEKRVDTGLGSSFGLVAFQVSNTCDCIICCFRLTCPTQLKQRCEEEGVDDSNLLKSAPPPPYTIPLEVNR